MNNNTIEPRLIALLNDAVYGPPLSSPSLELPPLHDPNILKASGRPLLLEPDASQSNGAQTTNTQLSSKHSSSIPPLDGDNDRTQTKSDSKPKPGDHNRDRALGGTSPQSLSKILDDVSESPNTISAKKRHNGGTGIDGFLKLPQPPPKRQRTVKVPPIIIGLFQPPEPPSQAALFPPIASGTFRDRHGRHSLNFARPKSTVAPDIPSPDSLDASERPKQSVDNPNPRPRRNAKRTRQKWEEQETRNLLLGVAKHGTGNWKDILADPAFSFNNRSTTDLKDRFRTCCPAELSGKRSKTATIPLSIDNGNKLGRPKSKSSLMSENILIDANDICSPTSEKIPNIDASKRAHRKDLTDLAQLGINEPFPTSRRRQRRPYSDEEDQAILEGYSRYGPSWRRIQVDSSLNLQSRSATDIRDRFRYMGKLHGSVKSPQAASVLTSQQNSMSTLTQEFEAGSTEAIGKEPMISSSQDLPALPMTSRDGLRIQEIISADQETPRIPNLQNINSLFGFKDNYNFSDHSTIDTSDNMALSQSFDWHSGIPAPFSSNEMDISRVLLDETWIDGPGTNGKERPSYTDINSILTTSADPVALHNGPSFYHMLNDPDQIDDITEGHFG